ncbi:hypothetical protein M378DRAFT_374011 [Amanita muscaria Koide BX008]|uniref:Uncharacterized protein n=1 Tax=Amanita muscaria (strain Koide BX008) TaxID=946122 RepID=A0A0C2XBE9_AMAMK|nr:hypothetical protein M378DRAFT_374011 [Amanita muscaria Koide BX008]
MFEIVVVAPSALNLRNEIAQLSPRFMNENDGYYLFRSEYNKSISVDRLALSVEILCDISTEEGVTLPTHEELLIKLSQGSYNDDSDEVDMHEIQDLPLTIKQPIKKSEYR